MVNVSLNVNSILSGISDRLTNAAKSTLYEMKDDIAPYVPYDTGKLDSSCKVDEENLCVSWDTEYAGYVYDMPKSNNFNRNTHSLATSEWCEEARQAYENKWIDDLKKHYSSNEG